MTSLNRDGENESFGTGNCEFWLSSDIDTSTSDWSEVDKRLKAIYETAASIDDRSDFNCLLPALHSELEKVRQETRKECIEIVKGLCPITFTVNGQHGAQEQEVLYRMQKHNAEIQDALSINKKEQ